jgi:hypothetical protein
LHPLCCMELPWNNPITLSAPLGQRKAPGQCRFTSHGLHQLAQKKIQV